MNQPYDRIILATTMFGSVSLFAIGLEHINKAYLSGLNPTHPVNILNYSVLGFSGSVLLYGWYRIVKSL